MTQALIIAFFFAILFILDIFQGPEDINRFENF